MSAAPRSGLASKASNSTPELASLLRLDVGSLKDECSRLCRDTRYFKAFLRNLEAFGIFCAVTNRQAAASIREVAKQMVASEGQLLADLAELLQDGHVRCTDAVGAPGVSVQWGNWEDGPVGNPWRAAVAARSDVALSEAPATARKLLEPLFLASDALIVIDPALSCSAAKKELGLLACLCNRFGIRRLEVFSEFGLRGKNPDLDAVVAIQNFVAMVKPDVHVQWEAIRHDGNGIHDRCLAFGQTNGVPHVPPEQGWLAVSIGCGVKSISDEYRRPVTLARIPPDHFRRALRHVMELMSQKKLAQQRREKRDLVITYSSQDR